MPLAKIQRHALAAIAANRHPGSHIGGGAVINESGQRYSKDIDIFHDLSSHDDRIRLLAETVDFDAASLINAGFSLDWQARHPELYRAVVRKDDDTTLLEWVIDSDFRFFEPVRDDLFGYRLHLFDIATNKALAAASRKEPRDVVDLVSIHREHFPLGAVLWAAPAKDPGYTPESLVADIRRNAIYRQDDYSRLSSEGPIDARAMSLALKTALSDALDFISAMPPGHDGLVFLRNGRVVQPDPANLEAYSTLRARRFAHWPGSSEIASSQISET